MVRFVPTALGIAAALALSVPVSAAAPPIAPTFTDEVDLINQAVDALQSGDLTTFDALGVAASELDSIPQLAVEAFAERDVEVLINLGELFDETDLEYLTWADDAVSWEQRLLAEHLADPTDADLLQELRDVDADGEALLFLSASRDIEYSPATERLLGPLDLNNPPSASNYEQSRTELRTMYDNGITRVSQLTDAMIDPSATSNNAMGTTGFLALGGISIAAVGLGIFALRRTRQADDHARLAITDGLTGLHNRRKFDDDLEDRVTRGAMPVAMLMIDVDHFKAFNDTHGHAVGDDVLRLVGTAVSDSLRTQDLAYRYGGEEFCALLPNTTVDEAVHVAERVRQAISAIELPVRGNVTASIGVSTGASVDVVDVVRHADGALYDAKASGRNCVATA